MRGGWTHAKLSCHAVCPRGANAQQETDASVGMLWDEICSVFFHITNTVAMYGQHEAGEISRRTVVP